jgi:phenylacetate-coenzyme A ligase PaaK-like adenylate-forming protein
MSIINISNKPCQCRNTDNWADDILGPLEQQCILRKGEIIQQKTENKSFQVTERKRNFQLFVHLRLQERMQRCIIMNIFLYPSEILTADNRNK